MDELHMYQRVTSNFISGLWFEYYDNVKIKGREFSLSTRPHSVAGVAIRQFQRNKLEAKRGRVITLHEEGAGSILIGVSYPPFGKIKLYTKYDDKVIADIVDDLREHLSKYSLDIITSTDEDERKDEEAKWRGGDKIVRG